MTWVNALDVEGATLVCRTVDAPTVWVDALEAYGDYFSVADGLITILPLPTNGLAPNILEFGVKLPIGYQASNARASVVDPTEFTQITVTADGSTGQMQAALVDDAGNDLEVADMSAAIALLVPQSAITSPTEIGEIEDADVAVIVSIRAKITPP